MGDLELHAEYANRFLDLMSGYWVSQSMYAAAKLSLADELSPGPLTIQALASSTGCGEQPLYRLMRALSSIGIFLEKEEGLFELAPMGRLLCSDNPLTLKPLAQLWGDYQYQAWSDVVYSVRTGLCAYDKQTGKSFFDFMEQDDDASKLFSAAMSSVFQLIPKAVAQLYDFSKHKCIVDVGGSQGVLLGEIMQRNPGLGGVLFDLPGVIENGKKQGVLKEFGPRCEFVGGDFFDHIPTGGDLYLMSMIVHDWNDEQAVKILRNCREAMGSSGRLILVEMVIEPGNSPSFGKWLDLHMLVMHGGRERTRAEYEGLLDAAGFRIERITNSGFLRDMIEAVPNR